jgi:CheY-like chemotaxis protein
MQVEKIACSPRQILEDVASLMRVRARGKNLRFVTQWLGPAPKTIQTDPTRLRQILLNLVGNAIKFTEAGEVRLVAGLLDPAITPDVQPPADTPDAESAAGRPATAHAYFKVVDTGIGMNAPQVHRIFQPFTQADSSMSRKFGGTGLGLTISRRLAQMLGGDISVHSQSGQGSTFTLVIDAGSLDGIAMADDSQAEPTRTESEAPRPLAAQQLANCRILLAEDGPDNQRLISFHLKKAGAAVVVADNGRTACDLALAACRACQPFDVILMDIQMPELDGYAATAQLRAAGYPGPILALTAHAMNDDRENCLRAGCDDHVSKPVERQQLIDAICKHIRLPRATGNAA